MTISRARITVIAFVVAICGAGVSTAIAQTRHPGTPLPAVIKYDGDMAAMLSNLTEIYGVTIGLEVDPQQPRPRVGFYLSEPTLAQVLDAITRSASRYQWREIGNFIEVLPLQDSTVLLDTIVSNFRVSDAYGTDAINQLLNLSEVQAGMRAMKLPRRDLVPAAVTQSKGEKFSLALESVTLRQA